MFPLLLIALAALALSQQKKGTPGAQPSSGQPSGGQPSGGMPSSGPIVIGPTPASSGTVTACEFDQSIPPMLKDQAMSLLNQAEKADANVAGPLATSLDTMATTLEMSGLPKTAKCLRDRSAYLRSKFAPSGSAGTSPISLGLSSAAPMLVNVLPKPKA